MRIRFTSDLQVKLKVPTRRKCKVRHTLYIEEESFSKNWYRKDHRIWVSLALSALQKTTMLKSDAHKFLRRKISITYVSPSIKLKDNRECSLVTFSLRGREKQKWWDRTVCKQKEVVGDSFQWWTWLRAKFGDFPSEERESCWASTCRDGIHRTKERLVHVFLYREADVKRAFFSLLCGSRGQESRVSCDWSRELTILQTDSRAGRLYGFLISKMASLSTLLFY